MLVTGRPLIVLGMVTAPPGPVYPVMVIAPLFVVKVNSACTTAGSANSSSASSLVAQALFKCPSMVFRQIILAREVSLIAAHPEALMTILGRLCDRTRRERPNGRTKEAIFIITFQRIVYHHPRLCASADGLQARFQDPPPASTSRETSRARPTSRTAARLSDGCA